MKKQADQAEKKVEILNGELSKVEAALNLPGIYEKEPYRVITLTRERADLIKQSCHHGLFQRLAATIEAIEICRRH